jgi:hypothetical protein
MQQVQGESPEEYSDIPAIESRYGMLQAAIGAAEGDAEEFKAQVARETLQLGRLRGTLERHKLELQNEFDMLKQQHDAVRERTEELVAAADEASSAKGDKLLEFGQVLQTVGHLHTRCMGSNHRDIIKHRHTPVSDDDLVHGRVQLPPRNGGGTTAPAAASGSSVGQCSSAHSSAVHSQAPNRALADMLLAGRRNARIASTLSEEEQQRNADFLSLKGDVVTAMQQLEVVGSYIFDFARLVQEWETKDRFSWSEGALDTDGQGTTAAVSLTSPLRSVAGSKRGATGGTGARGLASSTMLGRSQVGGSSSRARGEQEHSNSTKTGRQHGHEWQLRRPGISDSASKVGTSSTLVDQSRSAM